MRRGLASLSADDAAKEGSPKFNPHSINKVFLFLIVCAHPRSAGGYEVHNARHGSIAPDPSTHFVCHHNLRHYWVRILHDKVPFHVLQ